MPAARNEGGILQEKRRMGDDGEGGSAPKEEEYAY